jgi:hypothetical protein
MKLKYTLLIIAAFLSINVNAQVWVADSVEMGSGYANDIFYNIANGNHAPQAANNWDIAFQTTRFGEPMFNATIRANHNKRDVQVYSLHKLASVHFGNLSSADTMVAYGDQLLNEDTTWGTGAFTTNRDLSNPFDFGWGVYDMSTHNLNGDSLYLVKAGSIFYQLWIQKYQSIGNVGYWFRIAKWDGTGDVSDSIKRTAPYNDRLFAYYNMATGQFLDREPSRSNWHIMFTQYLKDRVFGANPNKYQNYVGVLSNLNVKVAKVTGVNPSTVTSANYMTYTPNASAFTNTIGDDWKRFAGMWTVAPDTSYIIIPDTAGGQQEYYHLQFTRFDGTATGKIVFETRKLATVSLGVSDVNGSMAQYSIYPNPAQNVVNIMVDAKHADNNTVLAVTDITGKVVVNQRVQLSAGVNAYSVNMSAFPAGMYIVTVNNSQLKIAEKVQVQR